MENKHWDAVQGEGPLASHDGAHATEMPPIIQNGSARHLAGETQGYVHTRPRFQEGALCDQAASLIPELQCQVTVRDQ